MMTLNGSHLNNDVFQLARFPPLPRGATHEEKRRYRRDLMIYLAYRQGLTQQFIADAFNVSVTLVRGIVRRPAAYSDPPDARPQRRTRTWIPAEPVLSAGANAKTRGRVRRDLM